MGTFADLKARLLDEAGHGVSARLINQHALRAIEYYAGERFWFSPSQGSTTTVPGSFTAAAPAGLRREDLVMITVGGTSYRVCKADLADIVQMHAEGQSAGQPGEYAISGSAFHFYPTPSAAYAVDVTGVYDLPALGDDTASNAWTTEAADLIVARARLTICRDILKDAAGAASAAAAEDEVLYRLRADTVARINTAQMKAG